MLLSGPLAGLARHQSRATEWLKVRLDYLLLGARMPGAALVALRLRPRHHGTEADSWEGNLQLLLLESLPDLAHRARAIVVGVQGVALVPLSEAEHRADLVGMRAGASQGTSRVQVPQVATSGSARPLASLSLQLGTVRVHGAEGALLTRPRVKGWQLKCVAHWVTDGRIQEARVPRIILFRSKLIVDQRLIFKLEASLLTSGTLNNLLRQLAPLLSRPGSLLERLAKGHLFVHLIAFKQFFLAGFDDGVACLLCRDNLELPQLLNLHLAQVRDVQPEQTIFRRQRNSIGIVAHVLHRGNVI